MGWKVKISKENITPSLDEIKYSDYSSMVRFNFSNENKELLVLIERKTNKPKLEV